MIIEQSKKEKKRKRKMHLNDKETNKNNDGTNL